MPFRPSLRSVWTLIILAVFCTGLYLWAENSRVKKRQPLYDEKLAAANLMERALRAYQESTAEKGIYEDTYDDPRLDAIIGQQFSLITTEMSVFETKLTSANPNFAAVAVQLLSEAGVRRGDLVAVGCTGSYPGLNTAVLCACEALGATPVTIASVGSSWWGASDPEFTWVDMEALLNKRGLVHSVPLAASLGGINDVAVGISQMGRDLMKDAIRRNGLTLIETATVPASIERRHHLFFDEAAGRPYKAYVNIGDGIASLGHAKNAILVHNGLNRRLPVQNYPARGLIHRFNSENVPVIHLYDVDALSREYGLGGPQVPLPPVGFGEVFMAERYNLRVSAIAAMLAITIIIVLVKLDARLFKLREAGVDPDTLM